MTVNISSPPFELIIAGIDRTAMMKSINLNQPSTSQQRHAPITGSVELYVPFGEDEDYTYTTNPTIASRWAEGALITYKIANDSGDLVYHFLSGENLKILKTPSPISDGVLKLEIGDELAYQDQREADRDASGVAVGTSTARKLIVERVLEAAKITDHSIPDLDYPFDCPVSKVGGSFVQLAGKLVGACKHVLYCNSAGTVIAAPIDLDADAIATLAIGSDEIDYQPVDGSSIPTVTELTISGVCQVPDRGNYPLLITDFQDQEYAVDNASNRVMLRVGKTTQEILSEKYSVELQETGFPYAVIVQINGGSRYETQLRVTNLIANQLKETLTTFDASKRLLQRITRSYVRLLASEIGGTISASTPFFETQRTIEDYSYEDDAPKSITTTEYAASISVGDSSVTLYPNSRQSSLYSKNLPFWTQVKSSETSFTAPQSAYKGSYARTISIDGKTFPTIGFPDNIPSPNLVSANRSTKSANDDSTRPPAPISSEKDKVKNIEITAKVNAIPMAGVPSREALEPTVVDCLVSNAHAYEYGKLEVVLMNGRKQARLLPTALTDELLALRPRCRIDVIFRSVLYRCLVDAITFSQDLTERTVGFICDVISTSPVDNPSLVYNLSTTVNAVRGEILIDAIAEGTINQTFDIGSIVIDAILEGIGGSEGQIEGEIAIDAIVFGILSI